jgi:hypothetical protein
VKAWPTLAARIGSDRMAKAVKKVRGVSLRAQMWLENRRLRRHFES